MVRLESQFNRGSEYKQPLCGSRRYELKQTDNIYNGKSLIKIADKVFDFNIKALCDLEYRSEVNVFLTIFDTLPVLP